MRFLKLCQQLATGLLLVFLLGCTAREDSPPTATLLPALGIATETSPPTLTPTEVVPTVVSTPTTVPFLTATPIPTLEQSPTPTIPLPPTATPYPTIGYLNDQWKQISVPSAIQNGLDRNWLAFANYNDTARPASASATAEPPNPYQDLYLVRPDTHQRVKVAEIPVTAGDRIFWSPAGTHVVYFAEPGVDEVGNPIGGLYMVDFKVGLQYRLFAMDNLNPRGIPGHVPVWSADGGRLAIVLPTEYATDIFVMNADGSNFRNLTDHGSYDLYPAFSPDGLWLAFVSDRLQCPTWTPGEPGSCAQLNAPTPQDGNLFVMNLNTGEVRQVTDVRLNGAPHWITPTKLEFSTGGGNALSTQSQLWLVDVEAGSAVQISPSDAFSISESWTDDAGRVVYQRATASTEIVVADNLARDLAVTSEFAFPRYGMTADWSSDGEYLAIGGRNGQCPYGIIVTTPALEIITAPAQNILACDPTYAPSSPYLAFTAIRPGIITDGSLDIYIGNLNGLGASNITFDLEGQNRLLGWVGITPP